APPRMDLVEARRGSALPRSRAWTPGRCPGVQRVRPGLGDVMRYNLIKITDSKGRWFLIEIWTPSNWTRLKFWQGDSSDREGDWQTLDKGFLSVNSGDARRSKGVRTTDPVALAKSAISDADLWLGKPGANNASPFIYGVILYGYDNARGTNSSGTGE